MVAFYDHVFTQNPVKWTSDERDGFAFDHLSEPSNMLDVGCGNGHTIRYLMNEWPETEFYGVDISPVAIDLAQKKVPSAKFFVGTIRDLNIPKVGLVTVMGVAEHFEDLRDLSEIGDLLAPFGVVYLEVPNCLSYSDSKEEGFRETTGGSGQREWHLKRKTWEQAIADAGFEVVESLMGDRPSWEFIWILKSRKE